MISQTKIRAVLMMTLAAQAANQMTLMTIQELETKEVTFVCSHVLKPANMLRF